MFDFNKLEIQITIDEILSKVTEFDIFKRYIHNFEDINKPFTSELRADSKPDCRVYVTHDNRIRYKDFAEGSNYDCFNYIMRKYGCNYYESLNIVATDFNIRKIGYKPEELPLDVVPKRIQPVYQKVKSRIEIVSQPWNLVDYNYWQQFGISFDILDEYNCFSVKYCYLYKGDKRYISEYSKSNPIYAYRFTRADSYSYKIYKPLEQDKSRKWLFSGGASDDIEGYDQLPLHGDILILTKSLKDCMCYNVLGYSAISLQGEANKLEQELVTELLKRFDQIIVNYDNDTQGISSTSGLVNKYGFKHFYIDEAKDLSDYIKANGLDKAKELINNKINLCIQQ